MRRPRRLPPDTRPRWQDAPATLPPSYIQKARGELEFVDRLPAELKPVAWERPFSEAYQAFQAWRSQRVRGSRGASAWNTATALGSILQSGKS